MSADELLALTETFIGPVTRADVSTASTPITLGRMLNPSSDGASVLEALRAELDGGPATGFSPSLSDDGAVQASFTSMVVHATRVPVS